jgi:hypothetical protein
VQPNAWIAFRDSTKIKKVRLGVKIAVRTRHQPIVNAELHVTFVVRARQHQMEAWFVRNAWPGNLKKPQAQVEPIVPFVYPASTRTFQTCQRASSAHVGMLNRLQNKRRALNAAPVNSMMLPVRFVVHCVQIRRTLVTREETPVASIVQLVGRPKTAVRNVIRAMLADLAKPKVFVQHARMVLIKRTKAKQNAASATVEKRTSIPKQHAVVVTLVHLVAGMAFARHARLVFIKIPKVNRNAMTFVPRLEKYPTMKARGVNCHRGVLAKWANI